MTIEKALGQYKEESREKLISGYLNLDDNSAISFKYDDGYLKYLALFPPMLRTTKEEFEALVGHPSNGFVVNQFHFSGEQSHIWGEFVESWCLHCDASNTSNLLNSEEFENILNWLGAPKEKVYAVISSNNGLGYYEKAEIRRQFGNFQIQLTLDECCKRDQVVDEFSMTHGKLKESRVDGIFSLIDDGVLKPRKEFGINSIQNSPESRYESDFEAALPFRVSIKNKDGKGRLTYAPFRASEIGETSLHYRPTLRDPIIIAGSLYSLHRDEKHTKLELLEDILEKFNKRDNIEKPIKRTDSIREMPININQS